MSTPSRCYEACWTPIPCPTCDRRMDPRGRSVALEMACLRSDCPGDDPSVNPRHLWSADDEERWRFYPDEAPGAGGDNG
jgi:hypothetical protein